MKINYFDLGLHDGNEFFALCSHLKNNYSNWEAHGFEACEVFYNFCQERFKFDSRIKIIHGAISNTEDEIKLYYAKNPVGHSIFQSKNPEVRADHHGKDIGMPMLFEFLDRQMKDPQNETMPLKKWVSLTQKWAASQGLRLQPNPNMMSQIEELNEENFKSWYPHKAFTFVKKDGKRFRPDGEVCKGIIFSKWLEKNVHDFEKSFNILRVNIEGAEIHLFEDLIENDLVKHFDIFCGTGHDVEKISEHSTDKYYKMLKNSNIKLYRFSDYKPELNDNIAKVINKKLKMYEDKNVLP